MPDGIVENVIWVAIGETPRIELIVERLPAESRLVRQGQGGGRSVVEVDNIQGQGVGGRVQDVGWRTAILDLEGKAVIG